MVIELPAGDDDHVDLECDGDGGSGKATAVETGPYFE